MAMQMVRESSKQNRRSPKKVRAVASGEADRKRTKQTLQCTSQEQLEFVFNRVGMQRLCARGTHRASRCTDAVEACFAQLPVAAGVQQDGAWLVFAHDAGLQLIIFCAVCGCLSCRLLLQLLDLIRERLCALLQLLGLFRIRCVSLITLLLLSGCCFLFDSALLLLLLELLGELLSALLLRLEYRRCLFDGVASVSTQCCCLWVMATASTVCYICTSVATTKLDL